MEIEIKPCARLQGTAAIPGDKSISHRAVMLGALAEGETVVENFLMGEDCLSTVKCFQAMGVAVSGPEQGRLAIKGVGLRGLKEPADVLDAGNSGTTTRLMLGILAGQDFFTVITGDSSLRGRPMSRVTAPLAQMGAAFLGRQDNNRLPLAVRGGRLKPVTFHSPVASAQVKSAVLLAGLFAPGETRVDEPALSRDHTERMLANFGATVHRDGLSVTVQGFPVLTGRRVQVPGDISSAAFLLVAAAMRPGSDVTLTGVGINPTRNGIIQVLQRMGAAITLINVREQGGEPVADLRVQGSALQGVELAGDMIPRLIDEIPVLAVAGAYAGGTMVIRDAAELKVKESNRIATVVRELSKFGVNIEERPDGMVIHGGNSLNGAVIESFGDHRIAMAMAVAGLGAEGRTRVRGAESITVSFPGFLDVLNSLRVE